MNCHCRFILSHLLAALITLFYVYGSKLAVNNFHADVTSSMTSSRIISVCKLKEMRRNTQNRNDTIWFSALQNGFCWCNMITFPSLHWLCENVWLGVWSILKSLRWISNWPNLITPSWTIEEKVLTWINIHLILHKEDSLCNGSHNPPCHLVLLLYELLVLPAAGWDYFTSKVSHQSGGRNICSTITSLNDWPSPVALPSLLILPCVHM